MVLALFLNMLQHTRLWKGHVCWPVPETASGCWLRWSFTASLGIRPGFKENPPNKTITTVGGVGFKVSFVSIRPLVFSQIVRQSQRDLYCRLSPMEVNIDETRDAPGPRPHSGIKKTVCLNARIYKYKLQYTKYMYNMYRPVCKI